MMKKKRKLGALAALVMVALFPLMVIGVVICGRPLSPTSMVEPLNVEITVLLSTAVMEYIHPGSNSSVVWVATALALWMAAIRAGTLQSTVVVFKLHASEAANSVSAAIPNRKMLFLSMVFLPNLVPDDVYNNW